jgi:hypothetical protein
MKTWINGAVWVVAVSLFCGVSTLYAADVDQRLE